MSKNFGELALHGMEELDTGIENDSHGFSTIDLNGGQTPKSSTSMEISNILNNLDHDNNNNVSGPSYTSFGEALSKNKASSSRPASNFIYTNNSNQTSPKRVTLSESNNSNDYLPPRTLSSANTANGSTRALTPTSMLSSASEVSNKLANKTASTIESLKIWGKSAYKCTRQIVSEKLGKSSRTIDPELDVIIENLRETRKKYDQILCLSRNLSIHFSNIMQSQKYLSDTFADLAQKSPELINEFTINAETQRQLIKYGESLLNSISFFTNSLNTLCNKTMEDTFLTVRNYEAARLEYDAYRFDLESLKSSPGAEQKYEQINLLDQEVALHKERYDNLKRDVMIKIKFLDENRVKVMKKQLNSFHNAIAAYFSGNHQFLEQNIDQFNQSGLNASPANSSNQSFLEKI